MAARSMRRTTLLQRMQREQTARLDWNRKILAIAKKDLDKAFELWWPKTLEKAPWAKDILTVADAREGFAEDVEACEAFMERSKGHMFVRSVRGIIGRKRSAKKVRKLGVRRVTVRDEEHLIEDDSDEDE